MKYRIPDEVPHPVENLDAVREHLVDLSRQRRQVVADDVLDHLRIHLVILVRRDDSIVSHRLPRNMRVFGLSFSRHVTRVLGAHLDQVRKACPNYGPRCPVTRCLIQTVERLLSVVPCLSEVPRVPTVSTHRAAPSPVR